MKTMDFGTISTTWALLDKEANILILTEEERLPLAQRIKADNLRHVAAVRVIDIGAEDGYLREMQQLTEKDLLIVLLTMEGFMKRGYRNIFSPFIKPSGPTAELAGKYIFIRLDIPEEALLTGLGTSLEKVEAIIKQYRALSRNKWVRVTADNGTDITMQLAGQELLPYEARSAGGHAFLPPAEISENVVPFSANGTIVADITAGELRFGADLIDPLGRVDTPVRITVENGLVTDIAGGDIARRLKAGLDRLDKGLQSLVELGHGLSDLAPTGIIGVDESMNGTCHFGIGSRNPYHVDVVVSHPRIAVLADVDLAEK